MFTSIILGGIYAPFVEEEPHVLRERSLEVHLLAGPRMAEAEGAGVECLTGTDLKAVFHELAVFSRSLPPEYLIAPIAGVVEKGMPYMLHVYTNLVRASRFKNAFHHRDISQFFYYAVIGSRMLSFRAVGKHCHLQPVLRIPADVPFDSAAFGRRYPPDHGYIFPSGGFLEELFAEKCLGFLATTKSPEVSLSMRCTSPRRGSLTS